MPKRTRISPTLTPFLTIHSYMQRSQLYLVGLNDRNYFDLRAMRFQVQENVPDEFTSGPQRGAALGPSDIRLFVHAR